MFDYTLPAVLSQNLLEYWSALVDELVENSVAIRPVWQSLPAIYTQTLPYSSPEAGEFLTSEFKPFVEPLFPKCVHGGYVSARFLKDGVVFTTDAPDKLNNWYHLFWQPFHNACLKGDSNDRRIARAKILQSDMGMLSDPASGINDDKLIAQYCDTYSVLPRWSSLIGIDIAFLYAMDWTGYTWLKSAIAAQPAAAMVLLRVGEARMIKATIETIRSVNEYSNLKRLLIADQDGIAHEFVKLSQGRITSKLKMLDEDKVNKGTIRVPAEWLEGWLKENSIEFQLVRKWFDEKRVLNTDLSEGYPENPACAQSGAANPCHLPSCVISPTLQSAQATSQNRSGSQPEQGASHDDK